VGKARGTGGRNKKENSRDVSGYSNGNLMSSGPSGEVQVEKVELRSSARNKKVVVVEDHSNKGREPRELEPISEEVLKVERSEGGSVASSATPPVTYKFEEGVYSIVRKRRNAVDTLGDKKMASEHDVIEGPPGSIHSHDSGHGSTREGGMGEFMREYFEEQKRRDERREKQIQQERREARAREERDRAEAKEREDRLWAAMNRVTPAPEPEPRHRPVIALPVMKDKEEVTEFLPKFEAALTWGKVPEDQWRY